MTKDFTIRILRQLLALIMMACAVGRLRAIQGRRNCSERR